MRRLLPTLALAAIAAGCGATPGPVAPPKVAATVTSATPIASASASASAVAAPDETVNAAGVHQNSRVPVDPQAFRVAELPVASLPEPLPPASAPATLPAGDSPPELLFDWQGAQPNGGASGTMARTTVRMSVKARAVGRIRVGFSENAVTDGSGGGGVYVTCGGASDAAIRHPLPARWETVQSDVQGFAKYSVANAWFDPITCKAVVVGRGSVVAKSLAAGSLYGFRQTCAACPAGESLVLLGPRAAHVAASAVGGEATTTLGSFTRVVLPLRRGGGGSMLARFSAGSLKEWGDITGSHPPSDGEIEVGVELTQAVSDPEPVAIAYVGAAKSDSIKR